MKTIITILILTILTLSCNDNSTTEKIEKIEKIEKLIGYKLFAIAALTSEQIDGDQLELLLKSKPNEGDITSITQDSVYLKIHRILKKVNTLCYMSTPVYTLSLVESAGNFKMGVSSDQGVYYGTSLTNLSGVLKRNYYVGGTVPKFTDENGEWITGFYPIKNSKGEVISIVVVDQIIK